MMLTRLPSGRRASTIGLLSSMRRPIWAAMRCAMPARCVASRKRTSDRVSLPLLLDEDAEGAVHHDVGDRLILQQRRERTEAEHVVDQFRRHLALLARRKADALLVGDLGDHALDLGEQGLLRQGGDRGGVDARQAQRAQFRLLALLHRGGRGGRRGGRRLLGGRRRNGGFLRRVMAHQPAEGRRGQV